jgi:citronellol/citronellal dehydrogenase
MGSYRSVFQPGLLAGKVVIVTGGGSGIGRCTAHELAALGAAGFLIARECMTQWMAAQRSGAVVNIIADIWGGMLNFTETAALEWAPIRVNAVAPGWIASSGMDPYPPAMRDTIRGMKKLVPLQRLGTESEVSAAIVFLLSPAASFISGACLRIDGAAPNAKRIWPEVGTGGSTEAFDGFHLATTPQVLQG